jgi:hypothetical protein
LRLVTLWAWLMRWPVIGVFPQNWQCWAIASPKSAGGAGAAAKGRIVLTDWTGRKGKSRPAALAAAEVKALSFGSLSVDFDPPYLLKSLSLRRV